MLLFDIMNNFFFLEKQTLQIVKKNTVEAQQSIFGYY